MFQEIVFSYCKLNNIKVSHSNNIYFLRKKNKRVATISHNINEKIVKLIEDEDGISKTSYSTSDNFIKGLRSKINIKRMLNNFKNTSRPRPWKQNQHRNKITEMGRDYIMEYTQRQNGRAYNVK
jgi:hypothetical protein